MADSDITALFDAQNPELWPEQDRLAFRAGYDAYLEQLKGGPPSVVEPVFDPPAGCERAYQAGWDRAKRDQDERDAKIALGLY